MSSSYLMLFIHHFRTDRDDNTPCLPLKILHNRCPRFLLGRLLYPGETGNNYCAKLWGANKVHYGLSENGEFAIL